VVTRTLFIVVIGFTLISCAEPYVGYQPPFLPIQFTIDESGVSVSGDASFATPLGVFTVGARAPIVDLDSDDIILILRDSQHDTDTMYQITGRRNARIVVNGRAEIEVNGSKMIVNVLDGQIVELRAPGLTDKTVVDHPGPYHCQLQRGKRVGVREDASIWAQPSVQNAKPITTLPVRKRAYIVSGPEWGRIRQDIDYSGWWWQISKTRNGKGIGWIWEGRITECNYKLRSER
jgi:hypothetical protein